MLYSYSTVLDCLYEQKRYNVQYNRTCTVHGNIRDIVHNSASITHRPTQV